MIVIIITINPRGFWINNIAEPILGILNLYFPSILFAQTFPSSAVLLLSPLVLKQISSPLTTSIILWVVTKSFFSLNAIISFTFKFLGSISLTITKSPILIFVSIEPDKTINGL